MSDGYQLGIGRVSVDTLVNTSNQVFLIVGRVCSDRPADHKEAFNITEPQNDLRVSFSHYNNYYRQ